MTGFEGDQQRFFVYHLTAWRRAVEEAFSHIEGRVLLLRSSRDGELMGGLPLYTVKSWLLGNRLVSIPFASYCDPLVPDSALLARLTDEAWRFAGARKLASLEIRLFRASALAERGGLGPVLYSWHHHTDLRRPVEEIWKSFSKTSVRQPVLRAEKAGVQTGDLIVSLDDVTIRSMDDLILAVRRRAVGDEVTLTLWRDGEKMTVDMTIGIKPQDLTTD